MYAWSPVLAYPYESSWSILQKITLLNGMKPMTLLRQICATHVGVDPTYRDAWRSKSFANTAWVSFGSRSYAGLPPVSESEMVLQEELLCHGGQVYLGHLAKRLLAHDLRICPTCIAEGFHCIAHQIDGIGRCPIHEMALVSACPTCGKSLHSFEPYAWFQDFECPACKCRLLKGEVPQRPNATMTEAIITRVQPLIAWLNSFRNETIAWPVLPTDFLLRVADDPRAEATTFDRGILWAFHHRRPFDGAKELFGPEPCGFHLHGPVESPSEVDAWHEPPREVSCAAVQKRIDAIHALVMMVVKEERRGILTLAREHGECCQVMHALFQAFQEKDDADFVSRYDAYCSFAHAFYMWEFYLKRALDTLATSVRCGWAPVLDGVFRDHVRDDVRSLLSLCAQGAACHYRKRHDKGESVLLEHEGLDYPFLGLNGERSMPGYEVKHGPSSLVFCLEDFNVFKALQCDEEQARAKLMRQRQKRMEEWEAFLEEGRRDATKSPNGRRTKPPPPRI